MKSGILFIVVLLTAQQSVGVEVKNKLDIQILYESLCPDSMSFIAYQLKPAYNEISKYVNITFVPFGKSYSTKSDTDLFKCQHGPKECQGNRVQSCVLSALKEQDLKMQYVDCFMSSYWKNPAEYGQKCADKAGVAWEYVKQCYESKMGTQMQLDAEKVTNLYSPTFIPTIVYDKVFNQEAQDDSMDEFRTYVCERLQKTYPDACPVVQLKD